MELRMKLRRVPILNSTFWMRRKYSNSSIASEPKPQFHVTIPIFYVNSDPHIGHLYSAVLADAQFRWRQLRAGLPTLDPSISSSSSSNNNNGTTNFLFSAGSDEHGKKIEEAARARGISHPLTHCDAISQKFQELFHKFRISNTHFVRTSSPAHAEAVTHFWNKLQAGGHIHKSTYEGWYSTVDECFYTDNEVVDVDLRDGTHGKVSVETGSAVSKIAEENWAFDLSKFYDQIRRWVSEPGVLIPSHLARHVDVFMQEPSRGQLSISRPTNRCSWGIPVPGDPSQTIYVWLDALVNYLTAVGYPQQPLRSWPPNLQILGKDIFKFHAIYWPAFLLAADLPLPRQLFVHAHWLVDKKKMSKSVGNVVCPMEAVSVLSVDGLRYFLLKQNPLEDGNFTMEKAVAVVNAYLVNDLGNLLQRAINPKLNPNQRYPSAFDPDFDEGKLGKQLIERLEAAPDQIIEHYDNLQIHRALELCVELVQIANQFFQEQQPWKVSNQQRRDPILFLAYETVRIVSIFLQPVVPEFADKLLTILGIPRMRRTLEMARFNKLADEKREEEEEVLINAQSPSKQKIEPIFPRIVYKEALI